MDVDDRFWKATERAEANFTGSGDVAEFRRHMKRLGHDDETIRDRIEAIHPSLGTLKEDNPDGN